MMSTIQEIEDAIRKLPDEELATLRAWFAEFDAAVWDRQFERDAAAGRLDALADEALTAIRLPRRNLFSTEGLRGLMKRAGHKEPLCPHGSGSSHSCDSWSKDGL